MALLVLLLQIVFISLCVRRVASATGAQQRQLLITHPPGSWATGYPDAKVLKRQQSCDFGECGGNCLDQGAFCCGPAGTVATSPYWVCDNGACITSVRGTAGIVDCYDPDNPAGTTQSCIDNTPTTTCKPTDKCYTCNAYQPYCRWETYIASGSPTLSWFSCVDSKLPDATFFAATITDIRPQQTLDTTSTSPTSSYKAPNPKKEAEAPLSTNAIIGIAVGAGVAFVSIGGLFVWYCAIRHTKMLPGVSELSGTSVAVSHQGPMELDSRSRSELNSTTAYSYGSQPAMPYPVAGAYGRNSDDIDKWRRSQGMTPPDARSQQHVYSVHSQELSEEARWRISQDQGR